MGIRFHCPNGHKLNVKEFLAGKRGICPDCDAKFIVPASSSLAAVPVDVEVESTTPESPADSSSTSEIEQRLPQEMISARPRKSRSESRRERTRRLSFVLGTLVLLLSAVLAIVLWYQS